MSIINVAVIGYGYWGPNLMRNFVESEGAIVRACSDLQEDRLKLVQKRYPNVPTTPHFMDIVQDPDIDAVAIATPVSSHFALASKALENGKHVLVEKPITASVEEGLRLIELAEKHNKVLMVGHVFEYTGPVNKIKEILDSGEVGEVLYFDSTRINLGLFQHDLNVMWDLAPHGLSIMFYLLGSEPVKVSAVAKCHINNNIANIAYLTLEFESQLIAHFHFNWLAPVKVRTTIIGGTKKMIVYDDVEPSEKVKVYDRGVDVLTDYDQVAKLKIQYRTGDMYAPKFDTTEALKVECAHFMECIRDSKCPRSDGYSGLRVVKILAAAQRSIENGGQLEEIQ